MSKVTGQVWKVMDKEFRGKMLYSFRLESDPIYYRMNENRNAGVVESGSYIEFEADYNADGKSAQVKGTPKKVTPAAPQAAPAGVQGGYSGGTSRDASIGYQSSRKDALLFVQIALANGAITLPAKASAKLAALDALVDSYTALYLEDISTGGAVTRSTQRAYEEEQETAPQPNKKKAVAVNDDDDDSDDDE